MKAAMGTSISEIAEFSIDVLKLKISRGAVQKCIFRVSEALKPAYEERTKAIPLQKSLNVDETGWKLNGQRQWVWLFCNGLMAYLVISKSRGCQVLYDVLGENFLGALTSDFYSAYVKYASPKQQFCLAHLIRDVKFLTTLKDVNSKQLGIKILRYMIRLFKLWKSIFRILDDPELYQLTNNLAESTIRPLVRLRRISQGSRGTAGSNWTARAVSILATTRIRKISSWNFFNDSVNVMYFNYAQPKIFSHTF